MKAPEPNGINVAGDNNMFCAADALRWYHPASNTCMLSLPALHRQEVVTDDRGSRYPEGIQFTRCSLDFWWRDGREEIIRYSGDPRNSYLCTACQSMSVVLEEAISQCDIRWESLLSKDAAHLEPCFAARTERADRMCFVLFYERLPWHIIQLQSCVMLVHLPRGMLSPPPKTTLSPPPPPAPNETPYLLPLLCGMHTNRETGEGRQTESLEPSLA